ncbi:MAG: recombination protein RecR [Paludibacteraceae bacterium]|nr:recombination protein RecR [Paludibacteraceae bacterium]MBR1480845.1 recombination protein RecR [Paludibacteraceae bacterium]
MNSDYPSILLEHAVDQFASLPGVGRRTALRLVLSLLRRPENEVEAFTGALSSLKRDIRYCRICHNLSDQEVCPICSSHRRDHHVVCVVENVQDVMSIERTGQFSGVYHVLGGVISPMEGVGPQDIEIDSLLGRISAEGIREVILALPTTMEGDTTNFYIYRRLMSLGIADESLRITQIARGVAVGNELEYTDEITLGRSIMNRIEFKG